MNDFVALDTCLLCGKEIGIVINQYMKPIKHSPHSLSLCDKCKQRLTNEKRLLVIEIVKNKKRQITGITGRVAEISDDALKENAPNYNKIMKERIVTVDKETFDYLENLGSKEDEA